MSAATSRAILASMGWDPKIPEHVRSAVISDSRLVGLYTHSSNWDYVMMMLYLTADEEFGKQITFMTNPQNLEKYGFIMKKFGAIEASKLEDKGKGNGSSQKAIDVLNEKDNFLFLISPKGAMAKKEWRTGYYHIAKGSNALITSIGVDYETRSIHMGTAYDPHEHSIEEIEKLVKLDMKQLVPLYPENESVEIRSHLRSRIGVIDPNYVAVYLLIFLIIVFIVIFLIWYKRGNGRR